MTNSFSPDKLLTARQVADRLQVSVAWVLSHASGRRLPVVPSVKMGKSVRFKAGDIERFIEHCERCMAQGIAIQ